MAHRSDTDSAAGGKFSGTRRVMATGLTARRPWLRCGLMSKKTTSMTSCRPMNIRIPVRPRNGFEKVGAGLVIGGAALLAIGALVAAADG